MSERLQTVPRIREIQRPRGLNTPNSIPPGKYLSEQPNVTWHYPSYSFKFNPNSNTSELYKGEDESGNHLNKIHLTKTEAKVLHELQLRPNRVTPIKKIAFALWESENMLEDDHATVRTVVCKVRDKIVRFDSNPIETVRESGYRFIDERLNVLQESTHNLDDNIYYHPDFTYNEELRVLTRKDQTQVKVAPVDGRLLKILSLNEGVIVPYPNLIKYVYGYYSEDDVRSHHGALRSSALRINRQIYPKFSEHQQDNIAIMFFAKKGGMLKNPNAPKSTVDVEILIPAA
ncbi:MAG TPA: helix-turn-helix domain-containing protein [Patescibacteria group bacterium]|nr:helix-turn-helix domain-containing protein [Patescibacteria group bacterium]